jgi:hypothetical protein
MLLRRDAPTSPAPGPAERIGAGRRRGVLVVAVVVLLGAGLVVADALKVPSDDSVAAKLAEWGRDHGMSPVITWLETQQYNLAPPSSGGTPVGGIPAAAGALPAPTPTIAPRARSRQTTAQAPVAPALPTPALAPLAAGPALPGEGRWQTVVTSHGRPAVQVATLRPDTLHTSFLAGVMRIDPTLVRGQLHPGTSDPGGTWQASTALTGPQLGDVAAAFNGGFRLNDPSHNGYYSEGRTVRPLVPGKASLVLYADGTADVGTWNQEMHMSSTVASVRQNLLLLVDHGQVNSTCATGGEAQWGSTVGQAAYIHRSGFGVTAAGVEVYVGGPALSVCTLGQILTDAGVVRGMELDVNPTWVSGTYYHDQPAGPPQGFPLFPDEKVSPQHYLSPTSRDWYGWYLRP